MKAATIIKIAKTTLISKNSTCVIADGSGIIFVDFNHGVSPLIKFINQKNPGTQFYLVDKVIGKAAALLCVKANIKFVHAFVISTPACKIFNIYGVSYSFDAEVPTIQNRNKNGLCPMEKLSKGVETPDEMYFKVVDWLAAQ